MNHARSLPFSPHPVPGLIRWARSSRRRAEPTGQQRVLAVTGGKGGVGKTCVVVNLALALAAQGQRVLILDGDVGLANVDLLLGVTPEHTLQHFFAGERSLPEIVCRCPGGVDLLPAGSGLQELTRLSAEQGDRLLAGLDVVAAPADFLLIDTAAGLSENVIQLLLAAQEVLLVTMPEPAAILDAYAALKVLSAYDRAKPVRVVVNGVRDEGEAQATTEQIQRAARRFLHRSIDYLGHVVNDHHLPRAVKVQQPVLNRYPHARATRCFREIARRLCHQAARPRRGVAEFCRRLLGFSPAQTS